MSAVAREKLENEKLRKKLLLFNKIDFSGLQNNQYIHDNKFIENNGVKRQKDIVNDRKG